MTAPDWSGRERHAVPALRLALVNNMPVSAAAATQRQFCCLLAAAFPGRPLAVRRLTCLQPASGGAPGGAEYCDALADGGTLPDLVVVTGAEPVGRSLPEEPIWPGIVWLVEWASRHGVPVIWSCLAGHAAVRHLDGIDRVRLPGKLSGVFTSWLAAMPGRMASAVPASFTLPQSRYHGLPDGSLEHAGYRVLARSAETGADLFVRQAGAPFLFLQGHPEYEADTLMREYRRDFRRYLVGTREAPPAVPHAYFAPDTERLLSGLSARAATDRACVGEAELQAVLDHAVTSAAWQAPAARMIAGWLQGDAGDAGDQGRAAHGAGFDSSIARKGAVA